MTTTPGTTAAGDLSRGTSRRVSHERAPAPAIRMTQPRYEIGVDTGGIESLQLPTCFAAGSSHPLTGLQRFAHFRFCEAGTYRMLERVWQEKYTALRSIVRSFLFDDARVEDILQDALSRVLASGRSFPDELETYRYLRRAVFNASIDHYRASRRRIYLPLPEEPGDLTLPIHTGPSDPLALLLQQERQSLKHAILREITGAMADLPDAQQEAIWMIMGQRDMRLKDLCRIKGIPYSTLRSRMLAGVERLRRRLKIRRLYQEYLNLDRRMT